MCTVHMYRCVQYICTVFHTQQTVWREVFSVTKTTELRGCDVWDVFIEIENHIVCRRSSIRHKRDKNIQLVTIRRDFYRKNKKKIWHIKNYLRPSKFCLARFFASCMLDLVILVSAAYSLHSPLHTFANISRILQTFSAMSWTSDTFSSYWAWPKLCALALWLWYFICHK